MDSPVAPPRRHGLSAPVVGPHEFVKLYECIDMYSQSPYTGEHGYGAAGLHGPEPVALWRARLQQLASSRHTQRIVSGCIVACTLSLMVRVKRSSTLAHDDYGGRWDECLFYINNAFLSVFLLEVVMHM